MTDTTTAEEKKEIPESFLYHHDLYEDEEIKGFANINQCEIILQGKNYPAKITLTDFRVMIGVTLPKEIQSIYNQNYFNIPVFSISSIEKILIKEQPKYTMEIKTYDFRFLTLIIDLDSDIYEQIFALARPQEDSAFIKFAEKYNNERNKMLKKYKDKGFNGWGIYFPSNEFERQDLQRETRIELSTMNGDFVICDTYPEILYLPATKCFSEADIKKAMVYRSKNRIPILSYFLKESNGTIWRCSQNKPGLKNLKNEYDDKLLNFIGSLSTNKDTKLIIYDARPFLAAMGNRVKGGGYEDTEGLNNAKIIFCEIGNIHDVRGSLNKLANIFKDKNFMTNKGFFSAFESSGWPNLLYQIIYSSIDIAQNVKAGVSTILHCTDGWDRTSQLSALAQLFLDPFYRTIEGFAVLIEKDFLSFGHQFKYRNGLFVRKEGKEGDISPIFFQFLDCVHQIYYQYPFLFEFNLDMLIFLADHLNDGKYGTFLFNHEKERKDKDAKNNTVSIWDDIFYFKDHFINMFYREDMGRNFNITAFPMYKIRFWEEYYLRYTPLENITYGPITTIKNIITTSK
ncbi:MAG: hypothetical protein MJ252_27475 [archaeon]|nr:hypothetical protein [archaeon]